eukprot:350543-Chlamydomonas_euryale.AAC.1
MVAPRYSSALTVTDLAPRSPYVHVRHPIAQTIQSECTEELFAPSCCQGTPSGVNSVVDLPPTVPSCISSKIAARALE